MKPVALLAFVALAACTDPAVSAAVRFTPDGVAVSPVVSGNVGGLGVAVSR
jgi:hypothetical protein